MTDQKPTIWRKLTRVAALSAVMLGGGAAALSTVSLAGCLDRPLEPVEPRTTTTIIEKLTQSGVDKIDLLLSIDNSRSMADKQEILKLAVPDLVRLLVNPRCVDSDDKPAAQQPAGPLDDCPVDGTKREFEPILNIHIGVITSALGGHGADACDASEIPSENDQGHLIDRKSTSGPEAVPTWEGKRFLAWDPSTEKPTHNPQGETNVDNLIDNLSAMVSGAGEIGCGYEAQLESWYRFLVDPDPHVKVELQNNSAVLTGTDDQLLKQRADFMRPDSLLAIIMLSDENDCSIRDGGQYYFAAQIYAPGSGSNPYHLPKPRAACATDPNSPCCRSCGQSPGKDCSDAQDDCQGALEALADHINLRCFDQKRRFGIDFLWPIDRYTKGLTSTAVEDRYGNVVPNPVFSDLNPNDDNSNIRDAGLVFVAGIVGVPWQDIARRDAGGKPDLLNGLDRDKKAVGGFQSGVELAENGTWDVILGDPPKYVDPTDPLMIESVDPRSGTNPVTGDAVAPPGAGEGANPINGHEYSIPQRNDLQYACIFPLQQQRDCTDPNQVACDCLADNNDNPLCDPTSKQIQKHAKAYPGVRELSLLRSVGTQGIVGSICPAQQTDPALFNFGYRPAIGAIIERLKQALGGQCLPRSLTPDANGQVSCLILEAKALNNAAQCEKSCNSKGRQPVQPEHKAAVSAALADPINKASKWDCFCEIKQTTGIDLEACQNSLTEPVVNKDGAAVDGWCYVDATTVPPTGDPEIVANCPATERRIVRFVGEGNGAPGATLLITCSGE